MKPILKIAASILSVLTLCHPVGAEGPNRASQVLTPEIAQKVLKAPVEAGPHNTNPDVVNGKIWVSNSNYSLVGGNGASPTVGLLIRHGSSKKAFDSNKTLYQGVDVQGLGFPAYRTAKPAQLNVLKGSSWLIISVGNYKTPDLGGQETLAKLILPSIKD
jgi:hypothetical protein